MADVTGMPLCPQCELPAPVASKPALRRFCTGFVAFLGIVFCFAGALTQIIASAGTTQVSPKTFCEAYNFQGKYDCQSTDQYFNIAPLSAAATTTSSGSGFANQFVVSCCQKGQQKVDADTEWYAGLNDPSVAMFQAYWNYFHSAQTFFKNYKSIQSAGPAGTVTLPPYTTAAGGIDKQSQDLDKEATYLAHVTSVQYLIAAQLATFNEISQVLGPAFVIILCITSLLNLTCFSRKGFALVNLALLGTCFALGWASTFSEADALVGYAAGRNQMIFCKPFDESLFNRVKFVQSVDYYQSNDKLPKIGGGAALLGGLPCVDYKCKDPAMNPSLSQTASVCTHKMNPVFAQVLYSSVAAATGAILQFVGFIFLAGVLANIDNPSEEDDIYSEANI